MRSSVKKYIFCIFCIFIILPDNVLAAVTVDGGLQEYMVVQRGSQFIIRGTSDDNNSITVKFLGKDYHVQSANNKWSVAVDISFEDYGKTELIVDGYSVVKNIFIGDLWLCSGQSNMALPVASSKDKQQILDYAETKLISISQIDANDVATKNGNLHWYPVNAKTASSFSAVCLAFGASLNEMTNIPIGLINSSAGGTRIESWISQKNIRGNPCAFGNKQSKMFDLMIRPLTNYPVRGVLWYQGESNRDKSLCYDKLLTVFVDDWRENWNNQRLPIVIMQLPEFSRDPNVFNDNSDWAVLRNAQRAVASSREMIGLVVTLGLGDGTIHPTKKFLFGKRAAIVAYKMLYDSHKYPAIIPTSFEMDGDSIAIEFNDGHACISKNMDLQGLVRVAGADSLWYAADVTVRRSSISVRSQNVSNPVAISYGWSDNPPVGLQSCEDAMPVTPFRLGN